MNVGQVIAQLRREHGFSQEELADMLFVSKDLVSKWETGKRRPDYGMIEQLAQRFAVSPDFILEKQRYIFEELSANLPDLSNMPEQFLAEQLNHFLTRISRDDAELFVRRYHLLEPISEIASTRGMGENHVRSRLFKIRKKLMTFLKKQPKEDNHGQSGT